MGNGLLNGYVDMCNLQREAVAMSLARYMQLSSYRMILYLKYIYAVIWENTFEVFFYDVMICLLSIK